MTSWPSPGTQRWKASTRFWSWTWTTRNPSPRRAGCRQRSPMQLAREAQVVEHLLVAALEARPVEQQVRVVLEVVGPLLVLEELLAHEQHRDARRRQADPGRDARAAAAVPGARVAGIAEPRRRAARGPR